MAGTKIRVMIVDDIAETREQLRKLLSFDADIEVVAMAASGEEAVKQGGQTLPDVVLMDINLPGMDGIAATAKLLEVHPGAQVVMLSVQGDMDYMRKAMMAGARDYLTKPPSADELLDTIHRIFKVGQSRPVMAPAGSPAAAAAPGKGGTAAATARRGKVITVFSPKGGTGCTTVVVNTALALQGLMGTDTKVCVADASLQFGDVATFMKLQPTRTFVDLAPRAHELDPDLLNTILVPHPSGLKVLAAPPTPEDAEIFREEGVEETGANRRLKMILDFTRTQFDYLIIDTAHLVDEMMLAALDLTDLLLLVTRPVIPEIRGVRLFAALLNKISFPVQKVGLVINGVDNKLMGIEPGAVEKAIMPALVQIPLDERTALKAANYGVPIMIQNARTPLGQGYITLGQQVIERLRDPEEVLVEEPQKRAGLGRLL